MGDKGSLQELNEKNVKIVEQAVDAINRGDGDALLALFSDDIKFWMPGSTPVSKRVRGKDEFVEIFNSVAGQLEEMVVLKVTNMIPAGDWVVMEALGDSLTKNGDRYCNTYCHLWKIINGEITEFTEYNDTQLVMDVLYKESA